MNDKRVISRGVWIDDPHADPWSLTADFEREIWPAIGLAVLEDREAPSVASPLMRVYAGLVLSSLLVVTACGGESTEDAAANGSAPDSAAAQTSTRETVASTTPQDAVSVAATTTTDPGSPESDSDVVATSGPVTTLEPIAQATNPCDAAASILEAFSEFSESSDYQLQRERALAVLPAVVDSIAMVAPPADISEAWTSFSETWAITLGAYERGEDLDGYLGAVTEDTEERFGSVVGNVDDLVTVNDWLIANCGFAIYDM